MLVPMHKNFYIDEWDHVQATYSTQSKDLEAMLTLYPNPSQPKKKLLLIAECRLRAALVSFANREIWGATMMAAMNRERGVHLQCLQKMNMEDCWCVNNAITPISLPLFPPVRSTVPLSRNRGSATRIGGKHKDKVLYRGIGGV